MLPESVTLPIFIGFTAVGEGAGFAAGFGAALVATAVSGDGVKAVAVCCAQEIVGSDNSSKPALIRASRANANRFEVCVVSFIWFSSIICNRFWAHFTRLSD